MFECDPFFAKNFQFNNTGRTVAITMVSTLVSAWVKAFKRPYLLNLWIEVVVFVLRFYCPVNPMGSCQARSVYLTILSLGRLSPLSI